MLRDSVPRPLGDSSQIPPDGLAGFPNRSLLKEHLYSAMAVALRENRRAALLVIQVTPMQDHGEATATISNELLASTLAARLSNELRRSDTAAYLGGGQFAVLLAGDENLNESMTSLRAQDFMEALASPATVGGMDTRVNCAIGVTLFPEDLDQADQALSRAQAAMRLAGAQGSNQIYFYTPEADARAAFTKAKENRLRQALERQELFLHYQPQVDLRTGRIVGVEALLRWRTGHGGVMQPDEFLPLAEASGLILPIGEWVMRTACETSARWRKAGLPPLRMSVNLSSCQLQLPEIARRIEAILIETGMDPHQLAIEVTENAVNGNQEQVSRTLRDLKSIGVQIALDGFGTGYSSLSSLRQLPIDVVKIDRSFVPDVTASTQDVSVTRAIINMAHSLRLRVMAVGVESEGQLALLVTNQCDQFQGHCFSPAVAAEDIEAMLREDRKLAEQVLERKDLKRTLLLVDDEENILSSLRRLLRRDGYHIVTADCGQQGLQRLAEYDVDVIISDQRMPGMTGVEFLRRAKELYPKTVRMVLSGYTELQSVTDAINEGAIYKFLTKPWDDEQLRENVAEAFRKKEMADENLLLQRQVQEANRELAEVNGRLQRILQSQQAQLQRDETNLMTARSVLDTMPMPVIGFDGDGLVAFLNPEAEAFFGPSAIPLGEYAAEETLGPQLFGVWQASDGLYHDVEVNGRALQAVCRTMTGPSSHRGKLMVLAPAKGAGETSTPFST